MLTKKLEVLVNDDLYINACVWVGTHAGIEFARKRRLHVKLCVEKVYRCFLRFRNRFLHASPKMSKPTCAEGSDRYAVISSLVNMKHQYSKNRIRNYIAEQDDRDALLIKLKTDPLPLMRSDDSGRKHYVLTDFLPPVPPQYDNNRTILQFCESDARGTNSVVAPTDVVDSLVNLMDRDLTMRSVGA